MCKENYTKTEFNPPPLQPLVIKHTRKIICLEEIFVPCMQVRKLAISDLRSETKGSQFDSAH